MKKKKRSTSGRQRRPKETGRSRTPVAVPAWLASAQDEERAALQEIWDDEEREWQRRQTTSKEEATDVYLPEVPKQTERPAQFAQHCWKAGPLEPDGCLTTCMLSKDHRGRHQWTRDDTILIGPATFKGQGKSRTQQQPATASRGVRTVDVDASTAPELDVYLPEKPVVLEDEHTKGNVYVGAGKGEIFACEYGCPGMRIDRPDGVVLHKWDCPYWWNEGKDKSPWDVSYHNGDTGQLMRGAWA